VELIEAYLAELERALRGPRRAKADLLREARDGLTDAAAAHTESGADPRTAASRAVRDFGPVPAVAPAYQRELGSAQSVRTALLIGLVLAPQDAVWDAVQGGQPAGPTGAVYETIMGSMSWLGGAALLGCVAAVLLHGVGQRRLGARPGLSRAVGVFAVAVAVVFAGTGSALALCGPAPATPATLGTTLAVIVVPMAMVARFGQRCLTWA
jgi:hypothetical protein